MAGSAREEAERLVASVLARAVTGQVFGERWATGEPECCVCPVCKAIAAVRDPKPETAARLAGSAGDLAGSVAGLLRSVSAVVGERPRPAPPPPPPPAPNADQAWSVATRAARPDVDPGRGESGDGELDRNGLNNADGAWAAATNGDSGGRAGAQGDDPWAAATSASAASAAADYAAELAERRAAALRAAAEAERRVAEAAAQAKARREAANAARETGDTSWPVAPGAPTARRLDVWAAATADAGVASVASPETMDHDVAAAGDTGAEGAGGAGDEARGDGAA